MKYVIGFILIILLIFMYFSLIIAGRCSKREDKIKLRDIINRYFL